jgi:hypothetical protein
MSFRPCDRSSYKRACMTVVSTNLPAKLTPTLASMCTSNLAFAKSHRLVGSAKHSLNLCSADTFKVMRRLPNARDQ